MKACGADRLFAVAILGIGKGRRPGQDVKPVEFVMPTPNTADEPLAKEFSLARTARVSRRGIVVWTQQKNAARATPTSPI